jgi:2'-hydroxyisoflavone reductase
MRILVIGGTKFVGRHIVAALLAAGHDLTLVHRGQTGADLFPKARHAYADRNDAVALTAALAGEWDATVDMCGYFPGQVNALADALSGRGGRYVFVSSVSVYHPQGPGFSEDGPVHEFTGPVPTEMSGEAYGPLKVLCERAAREHFGPDTLIVRPTYVIGPHDHTGRFDYWVHRMARGGEVLCPGDPAAPMQVIDARDLADFVRAAIAERRAGVFHLVGASASYTFQDLLDDIRTGVHALRTTFTWADNTYLLEAGESADTLPLWSGGDRSEDLSCTADPAASLRAGLRPRPVADTARDALTNPVPKGMTAEREAELLTGWHAPGHVQM